MSPSSHQRISVVGCSGVGKSTHAQRIAHDLGLPYLELDSVFHQANWTPLDADAFRARVTAFLDEHTAWVIDGNYPVVHELILGQATHVVWLHPPRWRTMLQIGWRTIRRTVTREELWNGNREPWSNLTSLDPERSMLAWAWTQHPVYAARYSELQVDPRWSHIQHHCFRRITDFDTWLASLTR